MQSSLCSGAELQDDSRTMGDDWKLRCKARRPRKPTTIVSSSFPGFQATETLVLQIESHEICLHMRPVQVFISVSLLYYLFIWLVRLDQRAAE